MQGNRKVMLYAITMTAALFDSVFLCFTLWETTPAAKAAIRSEGINYALAG